MGDIKWTNTTVSLSELEPWQRNPRQITKEQAARLVESFSDFGQVEPIAVGPKQNGKYPVYNGHQRLSVLGAKYGWDYQVEVRVSSRPLTEKEREKLTVYLHKGAAGEWNFDALANGFEVDELIEWGFRPEELGLDKDFGTEKPEDAGAQIDKVEELREKWDVKTGQLWQLGQHRLICGDCTDRAVVEKVMAGEKASLCFTSPPYWVGKSYETQDTVEAIDSFIGNVSLMINYAVKKDKSRIVINTGTGFTTSFDKRKKRQVLLLIDKWTNSLYDLGWNLRHIRYWIKEGQLLSTSPKTDLIDQHCEFIATFENDSGEDIKFNDWIDENIGLLATFYNTSGTTRGQERTGKRWALRAYWDDIKGNANDNNHCAAFPLELVERHLALYTQTDELVYEPFSGSGTTIISCERFKRQCRAIEISQAYVAVALQRFYDTTGIMPQLISNT